MKALGGAMCAAGIMLAVFGCGEPTKSSYMAWGRETVQKMKICYHSAVITLLGMERAKTAKDLSEEIQGLTKWDNELTALIGRYAVAANGCEEQHAALLELYREYQEVFQRATDMKNVGVHVETDGMLETLHSAKTFDDKAEKLLIKFHGAVHIGK